MEKPNNFLLMLGLRSKLLLLNAAIFAIHIIISSTIIGGFRGELPGLITGGLAALLSIGGHSERVRELYLYNNKGQRKVARFLFQHRDVVNCHVDYRGNFGWSVKYTLFTGIIPHHVFFLVILVIVWSVMTHQGWFPVVAALFTMLTVTGICNAYAENVLNEEEIKEQYEYPQEFADVITKAKQEVQQAQELYAAKEMLRRERQRNRSFNSTESQHIRPRKPY
ncbi:MAG: hypothetical protein F6K16_24510 [Symploca sp. SIO2B6]|nr:hypothetical protein [Symploca sp. SIO2B6]